MTPMKSFSPAFLSFFFFLLFAFCGLGRVTAQVCGSIAPPEPRNLQEMLERQKQTYLANYPESLLSDVRVIGIKAHIIRTSQGITTLTEPVLRSAIDRLNSVYVNVGIEFVFCGNIDYIDSDLFYDFKSTYESSIAQYSVNDAINIYFANTVTNGNNPVGGYAHYPWDYGNNNLIAIKNNQVSNGITLIHEFGHYFGLYHTHYGYGGDNISGVTKELVARDSTGNCKTAGDRLCDTQADPDLSQGGLAVNCTYRGTLVDSRGELFRPDPLNFMSYAFGCESRFTPEQIARIKLFRYYRTLTCADKCQARRGTPNLSILKYSYSGNSTLNLCPTCPDYCVLKKTKVGNDVTFNIKITNNGTAISQSCNLGYGLGEWPEAGRNHGTIWDLKLGTLVIPSIKPCDTIDIPIKLDLCHLNNDFWQYPLYYFNVWADEYQLVSEEYETDNTGYCYFRDKCLPLDTIKVSASPPEYGDVWGGGIFQRGEFISVAATPKTGYSFVNWTERNSVVSLDRFYLFTINGNRNLVANFSKKKYTITANVSPINVGTTTGSNNYAENDSVTVTATVKRDSNYVFKNWTENGSPVSNSATYKFKCTRDRVLIAVFEKQTCFTITTTSSPPNGGSTTGGGTFCEGQRVTVSALAYAGSQFYAWTENGVIQYYVSYYTFTATRNRNLVAVFIPQIVSYNVTATSSPSNGGTTTGSNTYLAGSNITLSATPQAGYTFVNWTENGAPFNANPSFQLSVNRPYNLVANFTPVTAPRYSLTLSALPTNGGTTTGSASYTSGTTVQARATANTGFAFSRWRTPSGTTVSTANPYTFVITANTTLIAEFTSSLSNLVKVGPDSLIIPGSDFLSTVTVMNKGLGTSAACKMGYYLSTNGVTKNYKIGTATIPSLAVNALSTIYFRTSYLTNSPTIPNGSYYVLYSIDDDQTVAESNENDNIGYHSYQFNTTQYCSTFSSDGIILNSSVISQPLWQVIISSVKVRVGIESSGNIKMNYYLVASNGAVMKVGSRNMYINPFETPPEIKDTINCRAFQNLERIGGPNNYYRFMYVLGDELPTSICLSAEYYRGYMYHPASVYVEKCYVIHGETPFNNLAKNSIGNVSQTNAQLNYSIPVANKGNIKSATCKMGYYLKSASTGAEYKLGTSNIPALDTGRISNQSFNIDICSQTSIPDGSYHFISKIDDDNIIAESNENDNTDTLLNSVTKNCQRSYTISLSANPSNGGILTGNGVYTEGSSISINATANTGFSFINWTKNGTVVSATASTTITANADQTLVANFAPLVQQYTIATSANPTEAGTPTGGSIYNNGQQATITATANNGWRFANWSYNGDSITPNSSYSFTVNANKAFVANFVKQYNLTTLANPSTGGSVSGGGTYNANTQTTLSTTPNNGWLFLNWTENNVVRSYTNSFTVAADSPRTYVANYRQKLQYTIGSTVLPSSAGSVAGNGIYTEGGDATLTATPNSGWYFQNWTENNAVVSTSAALTVGVLSNRTLTANFTRIPQYTVSINQNPANAGTISGNGTYTEGTDATLTASAKRGFIFRAWTEDTVIVSVDTFYKFTNYRNRTLVANFEPITYYYTVATIKNIPIAGTVTGGGIYAENGLVRIVAKPDSGFVFMNWTENDVIVSRDTAYQFTAQQNRTLSANFILQAALCINFNPQLTVNGSIVLCPASSPITLTASGGNMYKWSTGVTTANITVSTGGTYQVTITDTLGCNIVLSKTITNGSVPTINIDGNLAFCRGDSTILTASGGTKYKWSTQDTTNALVVKRGDNYVVTVTNTEGCSATKSIAVTENALPNAQIAGSTTICTGSNTTLIATGGIGYKWSTGATTATITVSQANTYSVTVTDANGCKASTAKILVLGNALSPNITGDTAICQGSSTVLTTSGGTSYLWSTGATTATITVNQSGNYAVTVTNGSGCSGSTNRSVVVNSLPTPNISGQLSFCADNASTLTASGGASYLWSTGATTASIVVNTAGSFSVTATGANGCKASTTKNTTVNALPKDTISVTPSTTICEGSSATINVKGGDSYVWSTGQTTPTINVTQAGTYYVTVSNAANCRKIDSIKIEKVSRPIANFSFTLIGGQVTFLNNSFGTGFNWNFGNGISSTIPNPNINYTANGTYTITLIVSNAFGCFDTISKTVQVTRVSTDEFSKKLEVSVSPNPFNTQLTVRFATLLDFGKTDYLFITNILGQEIYRQNINTQQTTIETGNWTQGIYSLNMSYKGRIHVLKKVVKIK